jgi:hypothetical protein
MERTMVTEAMLSMNTSNKFCRNLVRHRVFHNRLLAKVLCVLAGEEIEFIITVAFRMGCRKSALFGRKTNPLPPLS